MNNYKIGVAFYKGTSPVSKYIQRKTNSSYSHCALVCKGKVSDTDWYKKCNTRDLDVDFKEKCDIITLYLTDEQYYKMWEIIGLLAGSKYDHEINLGYLLGLNINNKNKYNCVEYIITILSYIGFILPEECHKPMSPHRLKDILESI